MEEKIQVRASLGTKLPKFGGSKPLGNFLQRTTNGGHTSLIGKSNLTRGENKHSDLDRTSSSSSSSSFSLNWRKLKKNDQADKEPSDTTIEKVQDKRFFQPQLAGDKDGSRLQIIGKSGKQSNMLLPQKPNLNENLLSGMSNSTKLTKSTQFGRTSYSGFNGCKTQINGFYTNKPPTGLQRPRANSATTRNFSNKILPQSADNMKTFSNVRRSQSFSHSIQNPLLPSTPLTRSHSFNKEVDLSKPYETQNVPIRTILKPTLLSRTAKQYELSNGNEPNMKSSFTRTYSAGSGSSLKKPGLSNGAQQTGPLGYRMTRPSLLKPTRTQVPRETAIDGTKDPSYFSSVTEKTEHGKSETDKSDKGQEIDLDIIGSYPICNNLDAKDCKDKYCSDDIDDLSISSLSSSDKNDLTEDFSDEFIDLDEENKSLLVESVKKVVEKPYVEYSLGSLQDNTKSLLSKPDDWIGVNITGKLCSLVYVDVCIFACHLVI
ncbi:serine-rich coiled-coil domain-containing protein 2-like [Rhinophrynus dorsalis]